MTTEAQPPALDAAPGVGAVIREDALTGPGLVRPNRCPTGRNLTEFVGEGYIFKVTGRCTDGGMNASISTGQFPNVSVADGEIRMLVKPVNGRERLRFRLGFRMQPDRSNAVGYAARFDLGRGRADLERGTGAEGALSFSRLDERTDLATLLASEDWIEIAVRMQGPNIWVLANGQPLLAAYDTTFADGGVMPIAIRLGSLDDDAESAMVLRNFRVSQLAGS